jgi:kinesin family protein 2/24
VVDEIKKLEERREIRRQLMQQKKEEQEEYKIRNDKAGRNVDIEYDHMINEHWLSQEIASEHTASDHLKIWVWVRKRPIFKKEELSGDIDWISVANPHWRVHEPKIKVDGLTKYVENYDFNFDNSFHEKETSDTLYEKMLLPLIPSLFSGGMVTWFAYGQTGSGKTFTMKGVQEEAIKDIFKLGSSKHKDLNVNYFVSYFEIYRAGVYDLLNDKEKL